MYKDKLVELGVMKKMPNKCVTKEGTFVKLSKEAKETKKTKATKTAKTATKAKKVAKKTKKVSEKTA